MDKTDIKYELSGFFINCIDLKYFKKYIPAIKHFPREFVLNLLLFSLMVIDLLLP